MLHLLKKQRIQKRNNVKRITQKEIFYYVYVCRANERLKSLTMLEVVSGVFIQPLLGHPFSSENPNPTGQTWPRLSPSYKV